MKSLVVEDDPISLCLLTDILEKHGDVVACENGLDALEKLEESFKAGERFDLVCLDIMMPGLDGHEVLQKLRKIEETFSADPAHCTKVIMTTALDDSESILRSYTGRCAAYCVKPIDIEAFYNHLTELGLIEP